ncbi:MAG: phenylacetate-CoA ligase, partial [Gammaproteobacteria bacterium]
MSNQEYYDALETRDPTLREQELISALGTQLTHAKTHSTAYQTLLSDIDTDAVTSRSALAKLPLTRKSELLSLQKQ